MFGVDTPKQIKDLETYPELSFVISFHSPEPELPI